MRTVKILGPSCANCLRLELEVMGILEAMGLRDVSVVKVADQRTIDRYLIGSPPGLMVDDQLVWPGGAALPPRSVIETWLREALGAPSAAKAS